jgi:uncharacterized protein (TIGR02996 family)
VSQDEEALLAAIDAAPLDDAPRLIYADWLQERGKDDRAEYLRAVVGLLHPPETPALVARCVELATAIDSDWRERVGGRFEIMLMGSAALITVASLIGAVLNIALDRGWRFQDSAGRPVRLKTKMTREDAERFVDTFAPNLVRVEVNGQPLQLVVRPMQEEDAPGLFV